MPRGNRDVRSRAACTRRLRTSPTTSTGTSIGSSTSSTRCASASSTRSARSTGGSRPETERWRRGGPSGGGRGTRHRPPTLGCRVHSRPRRRPSNRRRRPTLGATCPRCARALPRSSSRRRSNVSADTITSKRHTGVTSDEMGHIRAVDGPAGTVAGLLKPRVATHREHTGSAPLIYAAAAPEPVAGESAVPLRRAQRQPVVPTDHAPPRMVEAAASVAPVLPVYAERSTAPPPLDVLPPPASSPLAPPVPAAGVQRMPAASTELPRVAGATIARSRADGTRRARRLAVTAAGRGRGHISGADGVGRGRSAVAIDAIDRFGGTARHPAGAARRDHPYRAAHRRAVAGAPCEHGPDSRFTDRCHASASAGDSCRHRPPPGGRPRRTPTCSARARGGTRPRLTPGRRDRCRVGRARNATWCCALGGPADAVTRRVATLDPTPR